MKLNIIIAASVALTSAANAAPTEIVVQKGPTARVSYSDLDVHSLAGRAALAGRIRFAAEGLCLETNVEALPVKIARSRCYRTAVADGMAQMNQIAG
jgi:UrcA family protein